jgi:hypothetical protein
MWQMTNVQEMAVQEILQLHKQTSTECQKALLKPSHKLGIREICDAVIQTLSGALRPVKWIHLSTKFHIDLWLLEGYKQLVLTKDGIVAEGVMPASLVIILL